jgi:hypothetical protein
VTYEFDRDTAVTPLADGRYAAELAPGWVVGGGVNGGYLLAVLAAAVRAALAGTGHQDPFSLSAHFVTASTPGPAYVETELVRSGGRFSTLRATLVQEVDGNRVPRIASHATFGDAAKAGEAATVLALTAPQLPAIEDCLSWQDNAPADFQNFAPLLGRTEIRFDPATAQWAHGEPSRNGVMQAWVRLIDDRPLDPLALLFLVDVLPPTTFDLGLFGWAPTLELTAHLRAKPAPGWAIVRHRTRTMAGGLFEEDCDVWDSTGRLVAQSRQLALQPRPAERG